MYRHTTHRRHWLRVLLVALTLILMGVAALAGRAAAGEFPHERKGLVLGFNAGGGSADLEYKSFGVKVEREIESVYGGIVRIGYGVSDQVVLSLEGHGFEKDRGDIDLSAHMTLLAVTWHPGGGGFFLRAGVGGGRADIRLPGPPEAIDWVERDAEGAGAFGLGYEWRLGRQFALGVALDGRAMVFEDGLFRKDIVFSNGMASLQLNWYL